MTGEVSSINSKGIDSNGDCWPIHAEVARALRCRLRPFDTYIGPYIQTKRGKLFLSTEGDGIGTVCLWPGGVPPAYCEPILCGFPDVYDADAALVAARWVLREAGRKSKAAA